MLKNRLKIALRKMKRHLGFTAIHVAGLAISMAACALILLWVRDERSYDRFHDNAERIFRAYQVFHYDAYHLEQTQTPAILATKLQEECPEIERVTRVRGFRDEQVVIAEGKKFNERGLGIADDQFFQLFSFPLVSGSRRTILGQPYTVAVSQRAAKKYFGDANAVGRTLTIFEEDYRVSGVFRDMPEQSHFHLDVLCSLASFAAYREPQWGLNVFKTYVLLRKGGSIEALQAKIKDLVKRYMFHSAAEYEAALGKGNSTRFPLQPLVDIHLRSHLLWEFEANGNATTVHFFTLIAGFILLIAVINYVNLSTARSADRAREVGICKAVGAARGSLMRQFMMEAMLTSVLAGLASLALLHALLPGFRDLVGKPWLAIPYLENPAWLLAPAGMFLLVGALAGIYPAVFLSAYKPASVLGGRGSGGPRRSLLRSGLVVFQFSLSILLLVATCIIQKQMDFIQTRDLGYDQEQVAVVKTFGEAGQKLPVLKETLLRQPGIVSVSASSSVPGGAFPNVGMGLEGAGSSFGRNLYIADEDFLKTMDMKMTAGRFFSPAAPGDGQAVVINETMARELGGGELLGKRLRIWVGGKDMTPFQIIGVIRDFYYESFLEPIKPLAIVRLNGACPWPESQVSIRVRGRDLRSALTAARESWREVVPGLPFAFSFLDTIFDSQYQDESRTRRVFVIFTVFAVLVACIGLLGLASFALEQRSREIGIRKVLGASAQRLALMLGGEFARWAALANLIAWPAAYLIMRRWLHHFAYRVEMGAGPFLLSALIMFAVTGLTVGYHTVRSAMAAPANSLRRE